MSFTVFTGIVCLVGILSTRTGAIYWQLVFCLFGCAAAIELPALGGAVITPAVLFLPFMIARAGSEQYGRGYSRRLPAAGVWLILVVLIGLVGAYFLPRIFAGQVEIVGVDRGSVATGPTLGPLHPVSGNVTQSGYAVGGVLAFLSMHALLEKPGRLLHFRDAVLLLASLDCAAALLNFAEFYLGFPKLLDSVRTAYALFSDYEIVGTGMMRVHGTFSETAGFSGFSLPLFAFTFSLWLHKVRPWYSGTLAAMLFGFLLVSTSTTAYIGLVLYGTMLVFVLTYRGYVRGVVPRIGLLVAGSLLAVVLVGSVFVLETELGRRLENYFEITVFSKMESASGIERGFWNRQAWSNFVDTYGFGVGLGTVRASSLALVLLSNLGALGTLFFVAFLRRLFTSTGGTEDDSQVSEAARQAILASLSAALPSGTVFDLGVTFYAFAAAACVVPLSAAARSYGGLWDAYFRAHKPAARSIATRR